MKKNIKGILTYSTKLFSMLLSSNDNLWHFANNLYSDQAGRNGGPYLDPNVGFYLDPNCLSH